MCAQTVETLIQTVCQQFEAAELSYGHGTDNAWDEAVALVLGLTGAADDESSLQLPVPEAQAAQCLQAAASRVRTRSPLAYILGKCQFMGFDFVVEPGVVIPRSPIGYLLHDGLEPWLPDRVTRILDLCCGSGCLGILAAHLFPQARVTMVELDSTACSVARSNIELHGLTERVELIQADVTAPPDFPHSFDLIVSNPPYVDAADMGTLPAEYLAEPERGLAAGTDGLAIIEPILDRLSHWLAPDGIFVGEVGASAPALIAAHQELPLIWPDLPYGGEGVFVLEGQALNSHTAPDFS